MYKHFIRIIIYLIGIAALTGIVFLKIQDVKTQEEKKIISLYSEWESNGKPVDVKEVKEEEFNLFIKLTATVTSRYRAQTHFTEGLKHKLQTGMLCYFFVNSEKKWGHVLSISQSPNFNGLYQMTIKLHEAIDKIKIDKMKFEHLNLFVITQKLTHSILIPNHSFFSDNGEHFVWVVKDNLTLKRKVNLGQSNGIESQIKSGLKKGELIVTNGLSQIKDNDKVFIRNCINCSLHSGSKNEVQK